MVTRRCPLGCFSSIEIQEIYTFLSFALFFYHRRFDFLLVINFLALITLKSKTNMWIAIWYLYTVTWLILNIYIFENSHIFIQI
jgi:hypothetical protein